LGDVEATRRMILATKHAAPPESTDEALVADIDMSILAAAACDYDIYAAAIRTEFSFVADEAFRTGRAAFLEGLLARREIFYTPALAGVWEQPSRDNIARELRWLRA